MSNSTDGISSWAVAEFGRSGAKQWLAGEPRLTRLADGGVRVVAPAKVNLTLWVGACRTDGYHQIESIVATISLADRLTIHPASRGCKLTCTNSKLSCDSSNLVIRAAKALAERVGKKAHLRLHLEKNIPIGAGLGGGSSDAAACLLALSNLWTIGYGSSQLGEIGAEIGSDVPLFLDGPLAVVRGRGELVEPLGFDWPFWAVLVCPPFPVETAAVYGKFDELLTGKAEEVRIEGCQLGSHKPESVGVAMFNMLEPAACEVLPQLAVWREALLAAGAASVQLCGSGSALLCLFNSLAGARELVGRLSQPLRAWAQVVHGGHR